jgi:hypothetical protein
MLRRQSTFTTENTEFTEIFKGFSPYSLYIQTFRHPKDTQSRLRAFAGDEETSEKHQ